MNFLLKCVQEFKHFLYNIQTTNTFHIPGPFFSKETLPTTLMYTQNAWNKFKPHNSQNEHIFLSRVKILFFLYAQQGNLSHSFSQLFSQCICGKEYGVLLYFFLRAVRTSRPIPPLPQNRQQSIPPSVRTCSSSGPPKYSWTQSEPLPTNSYSQYRHNFASMEWNHCP